MSRYPQLSLVLFGCLAAFAAVIGLEAQGPPAAAPGNDSFRLPAPERGAEGRAGHAAPLELTASDGSGLRLLALEARAVVEPPLAFTELFLTFENPEDRTIEGRFRIALPSGAAISRFAMKIDGRWQEGEVVERQKARRAYEDFLHRRQDPALLEQEAGNEFSARVFPIPARSRKEIAISYSHELKRAEDPFVIPLLGLPEIARLDIRALLGQRPSAGDTSSLGGAVSERRMIELSRQNFRPDRDFTVAQDQAGGRSGLRHGNLVVARVTPQIEAAPQKIRGLYLLVDSSASRALGYRRSARLAADLAKGLRDASRGVAPVGLAAFDQEVAPIFEGDSRGLGEDELARLLERRPLGASDLEKTLGWLAERLDGKAGRYPRVVIVTDGVATAGNTDAAALKAAVAALRGRGVERLDVIAAGGLRDDALLAELVAGNLAHDGVAIDGEAPIEEIARRLTLAARSKIAVAVPGAAWVWPEQLDGMQPGDSALVYADLPEGKPLSIELGGRRAALGEIAGAERPLLERQWVAARIARLLHLRAAHPADEDLRRALSLQVTELSVRHRVMSPLTAFLVLETEADYVRYGLDRQALADILTVGPGGIEVLARSAPPPAPIFADRAAEKRRAPAAPAPQREATFDSLAAEPATAESEAGDGESFADQDELAAESAEEMVAPAEVPGEGSPGGVEGGVSGSVQGGTPGGTIGTGPAGAAVAPSADARRERPATVPPPPPPPAPPKLSFQTPYSGPFAEVMAALAAGEKKKALGLAESLLEAEPGSLLALVALGEGYEAVGETAAAARAYGSLIDLYPGRADLRRYAGERLERLGKIGLALAIDTYAKAVADRPDHASGHRLLAWALLRAGRFEEAFAALQRGRTQEYPAGRFAMVNEVMRDDLGLIAAAWVRQQPGQRETVLTRLREVGANLDHQPSLRFVLSWETDANDVDLHVYDSRGGHAYYSSKKLPSGGELYADVTTGYGPESFVVQLPKERRAGPYRVAVDYYSRGPMGFGMGLLQVIRHDGSGGVSIEPRPFVVMVERTLVDLGTAD